ncbi:LysR family transcriptional regulator [Saccharopolyspora oryzae]|uniref:LysR family transcriptional regulator n=1 Tax=Saccharopolyspora TaxID=1835 RepID=UPI002FDBA63D
MPPLSPRMPEIGALEVLLSVARLGSLNRAAKEHGISQPAVSSRIRYMERLVGVPLLERSTAGSRLTPAGALVADWARDVVESATVLDAGISALRGKRAHELGVAASMTAAEYLVPGWLVVLHERVPELKVSLRLANSAEVARLVLGGEMEVGFVEGPSVPEGLDSQDVAADRLEVVVAPSHPWSRRRTPVPAAELVATPLIQREPGSGTRYTLERVVADFGPLAPPLLEASSTTAVRSAAAAGVAPAVISSLAVAGDLVERRLVAVPVEGIDMRRVIRAVWRSGHQLLGPVRDLIGVATRSQHATRRSHD